jgi:Methylmuconolactone methyl-isomerase
MTKIIELHTRKDGLGQAEFMARLRDHALLAQGYDIFDGYNVQEALPIPERPDIVSLRLPEPVGGFIEYWVPSLERYEDETRQTDMASWLAARRAFAGGARCFVVEEDEIVPPAGLVARNNAFLTKKDGLTTPEFLAAWHGAHGRMAHDIPYLRGFVLCDVVSEREPDGVPAIDGPAIDGVAQAFFDSREDEGRMVATPEAKEWFAHGAETFGLIKAFGSVETTVVPHREV